ncbi:MAG TPA: hypothetical protein VMV78_08780 [Thiobacillus sp.]|nr:hypothetical protein [Thiobacillus sp.]
MLIDDGKGKGFRAGVDSENRLETFSVVQDLQFHINEVEGQFYSLVVDQVTGGTNRHNIYIKNTSDQKLLITSVTAFATSTATELYALLGVTGTATSPSTGTPVNRNAGSGNTATGTFQYGANLALTGGSEVDRWFVDNDLAAVKHEWGSALVLPQNATFVLASSASTTINVTISFGYH